MIRLVCLIIGYAFGLIQCAYILGRMKGIDIRNYGSGNSGTTNMLRTMGTKAGLITFAGDMLKAIAAVLLVGAIFGDKYADMLPLLKVYTGFGVILGHNFPFYLNFKGGKGVASTGGFALAFYPPMFFLGISLFIIIIIVTHYVSLGSLTAYTVIAVAIITMGFRGGFAMMSPALHTEMYIVIILMTALCFWQHRGNIKRLATGTERKTYLFKKKSQE